MMPEDKNFEESPPKGFPENAPSLPKNIRKEKRTSEVFLTSDLFEEKPQKDLNDQTATLEAPCLQEDQLLRNFSAFNPHEQTATVDFQDLIAEAQQENLQEQERPNTPSQRALLEVIQEHKIGDYFIGEPLGEGSGSHTYLAYSDPQKKQLMGVLKLGKGGQEKQIFKEIEFAQRFLNQEFLHPNIVKYLKYGMTPGGEFFVVNEYLYPFPRIPLNLEEAFAILIKITQAVHYLHRHQLYHRDIKPENIRYSLYKANIHPKLFDFGTLLAAQESSKNIACSPYYAAPEVLLTLRGHRISQWSWAQADLFSLGMTFLGLLHFNPYFISDPQLSTRYIKKDIRFLIDHLILIHQTHYDSWLALLLQTLQKHSQWQPLLEQRFHFSQKAHQGFLEEICKLLPSLLHFHHDQRWTTGKLIEHGTTLFNHYFEVSIDTFLQNGACLPPPQKTAFFPPNIDKK
jgi:serine/threonine protein kinase